MSTFISRHAIENRGHGSGPDCRDRARLISSRTKEALAKRKADGMKLGRPVGAAKNLKLDKINGYLDKGINKVAIAKLLDVSPNTLYE